MSKKTQKEPPITKRTVIEAKYGTIIAEPLRPSASAPKSKRRINPITAARHLSALDSLLRQGIIDENRHAAELAMLKGRLV